MTPPLLSLPRRDRVTGGRTWVCPGPRPLVHLHCSHIHHHLGDKSYCSAHQPNHQTPTDRIWTHAGLTSKLSHAFSSRRSPIKVISVLRLRQGSVATAIWLEHLLCWGTSSGLSNLVEAELCCNKGASPQMSTAPNFQRYLTSTGTVSFRC